MNLRKHELIGLRVTVAEATDPTLVGLEGIVRDETRNMLAVETPKGEKWVPKRGTSFTFRVRGDVTVPGDEILFRPEDRIKRGR